MSFVLFLEPINNDDALAAAIKADGKVVLASVGYQETVDGKIQQAIAEPLPVLKAAAATGPISHTPGPDGISRQATQYLVDAIMAVFGIPFKRTYDAELKRDVTHAITACLAMHDPFPPLN